MGKYFAIAAVLCLVLTPSLLLAQHPSHHDPVSFSYEGRATTAVAVDSDGENPSGFYVLASGVNDQSHTGVVLFHFTQSGTSPDKQWHYFATGEDVRAVSFVVDPAHNAAYVAASVPDTYRTIKFNLLTQSCTTWVRNFQCKDEDAEEVAGPVSIALFGSDIVVAGTYASDDNGLDYCLVRYPADGGQPWSYHCDEGAELDDSLLALATTDEGGTWYAYVTGRSNQQSGSQTWSQIWTLKFNCSDDGSVWDRLLVQQGEQDRGVGVATGPDGVYVVGSYWDPTSSPAQFNVVLVQLDKEVGTPGEPVIYRDDDDADQLPIGLAVFGNQQDSIYITAYEHFLTDDITKVRTLRYLSSEYGLQLDYTRYRTVGGPSDTAKAMAIDGDGNAYSTSKLWGSYVGSGAYNEWSFPTWLDSLAGYTPLAMTATSSAVAVVGTAVSSSPTEAFLYVLYGSELKPQGWFDRALVPPGGRNKKVKDGGCMAYSPESTGDVVYVLKGCSTREFYAYDVCDMVWWTQSTIPIPAEKVVKLGGTLAAIGGNAYATPGNNTLDFWKFEPSGSGGSGQWVPLEDVPDGDNDKPVGEGAAAVAVPSFGGNDKDTCIYLLKGKSTKEFYAYHTWDESPEHWTTLTEAPGGPSGKGYKRGSCMAYNNDAATPVIYLLSNHYSTTANEFYSYNVSSNQWNTGLAPLPILNHNGRKWKVGTGAAIACIGDSVYAQKGNNKSYFWVYDRRADKWTELNDLAWLVGAGGGLAALPSSHSMFQLRGKGTREYRTCISPEKLTGAGSAPSPSAPGQNEVLVAPCKGAEWECWSADGAWVAYTQPDDGDCFQICKVSVNGGGEVQLTSSGDFSRPAWSPDGTQIAAEYNPRCDSGVQIALVPAAGGQVTMLTSADADHRTPEWKTDGSGLYCCCDDDSGFSQLYSLPANGGAELALTTSQYDHTMPRALSATEVVCLRDDDSSLTQVFKVNTVTGFETRLTSGATDYTNPSVAAGARLVACEKVDQDGYSQIVVLSADGGTENVITSGNYDYETPSICYDGSVVSCVRTGSSGSAVCVYDLVEGTSHVLTDALADRDLC